ncbi:keywimysin-related RiPP [Saccharothrix sp.]|nr:keywimysin-related RiPP [Saccharothrix sp.]
MKKRVYEAPVLIDCGAFKTATGFLGRRGRDHIVLSKH